MSEYWRLRSAYRREYSGRCEAKASQSQKFLLKHNLRHNIALTI